MWQPVIVMCLFGATSVAASIPVTNAIMNTAPVRDSGTASALRGAASSVGAALGRALMGGMVLGGVQQVLVDEIVAVVESAEDPAELAQRLEALDADPNPASADPLLSGQAEQAQEAFARAMLSGIRLDGVTGAGIAVVCAGLFWVSQRGRREIPLVSGAMAG